MALKITFLRLNELLLASVALFVFVYSDSDHLGERVNIWMTHNCTFPPKSLYEEIYPIFVPCFEDDIKETLSSLCSSLFTFSDKICIKRPTLRKYFTEESVLQKSNITNICSFAQKYYIGESVLQKYLGEIITDMTSCRNYCEVEEESAFAKICKLLIAGVAIYKESLLNLKAGNHGEKMQSPPPVTKGEKLNETKTQFGSDVKNASLLNTTVKPDIPVASSIENSTPLSTDTAPEISDTKPPTLPLSDVTNKIDPTITDSQPTSSQQKKPSDTYEKLRPEKEIKTSVSILPATDKQTFVPSSTQDASTFITSTIGTTQPEYLDNHSEENINEQDGSDIEIKTSNDKLFQREPDAKSTETDNQDNDFEDTPDKEGEKKKTKDDSHNKTQGDEDDSTQKENTDDDSTQKENTDDDSYNKSKNVQGNSDEDQNTENRLVEDNQEIDQDRDIVPKSGVIQKMEESDDDSSSSSHFMAYFVTALVLCIAGYVIYHNKQKIIAFFLEGRRNGRRRAALGNTKYSKLTPSVEEVMPSLETAASAKNFIY